MRLTGAALTATFYKRELPANCISFAGVEGRAIFREALDAGTMESYFALAEQFRTQSDPAFCGLGSLVMSLNALQTDPQRVWRGPWRWFDEEMLDCCSPIEVIKQQGISMREFSCLASCNGALVQTRYAQAFSEKDLRDEVERVVRQENGTVLVASYHRGGLQQTGAGHFSPIGGYHKGRDLVLVMDVARFKYPPHWVKLSELYQAMLPVDVATGKSRGWHLLRKRTEHLSVVHFPLHVTAPEWTELVQRVAEAREQGKLLEFLLEASHDPKTQDAFPSLMPDVQDDRWHIVERVKQLPVYTMIPDHVSADKRLVISLLYEALSETPKSPGSPYSADKPFKNELSGIANLFHSVESFCCVPNCARHH